MRILRNFIRQEKGGLALLFAIILPFLISCCALAFDGARIMSKKARLADALNEAALAVATASSSSPTTEEKVKLEALLKNYIKTYLPNENITTTGIDISYTNDVETGATLPVFSINAQVDVKTILPLDIFPAFEPNIGLTNQGKVRKGLQDLGRPADYVFVLDFSGSMNEPSAQPGMTRIALLKKVVKDITTAALQSYPETTFALVPFEVGVPVLYKSDNVNIQNGRFYPTENELGGAVAGCSVMMVPNKLHHMTLNMKVGYDIDYAFWANKSLKIADLATPNANATSLPYTMTKVNQVLNTGRYNYYRYYVLPSLPPVNGKAATWQDLINRGWCIKNPNTSEDAVYTCEKAPVDPTTEVDRSIFTDENQEIIKREIEAARRVFKISGGTSNTITNINAMDIEATLAGMFDESNIITFPLSYGYYGSSYTTYSNPFPYMCISSGHDDTLYVSSYSGKQLAQIKPNAYLIEPTSDLAILNEFQNMKANGATDSSSGLLRAVPEMLKGPNPRKVMIVISDGDDNDFVTNVRDALHKNRPAGSRVCDLIREGVLAKSSVTEEVDIYFISVVNDSSGKTRTKYWADYCTGADNAVVATNYDEIMNKLIEIMNKFEETGYFYN